MFDFIFEFIEFITTAFPVRSLLFLFFTAALIFILIGPSARLCFWQCRIENAKVKPTGFKAFSRIAALAILLFSFVSMAAGLYLPAAPLWIFYAGYAAAWASLPFMAGARSGLRGFLVSIFTILLFLSMLSLLVIPIPIIEKDYPVRIPDITEEDDRLEDKNPPYLKAFTETCEGRFRGHLRYFNKSVCVIGLDLGEITGSEKKPFSRIYPTFRAAKEAAKSFECGFLPSVDLIDGFTKHFDDRLMAAVEEHIHTGSSIFPGGKQGFLRRLLEELLKTPDAPGRPEAAAYLAAAIELGGGRPMAPTEVESKAALYKARFLNDPGISKPVGFYATSDTSNKIFQRDRFLQKPFGLKSRRNQDITLESHAPEPEGLLPMIRIAEVLQKNPMLLEAYGKFRSLAEKACNPEANLNVEHIFPYNELFEDESRLYQALLNSDAWKEAQKRGNINPNTLGVAFWPFSYSRESRLMARLYQGYELPKTGVMNDLIAAIREGNVDLEPEPDSGWYDYQLHALETLILPERAHEAEKLLLHAKYKKRLREAFEAMLTKRRETHVKQLFQAICLGSHGDPLPVAPELSLEPAATHYLRTARAFRFLAEILRDFFTMEEMSTVTIKGFDSALPDEVNNTVAVFYGLYLVACNDLGMAPKIEPQEIASIPGLVVAHPDDLAVPGKCLVANINGLSNIERAAWVQVWNKAEDWLKHLDSQAFLDEDVRVAVPVLSNYQGTKVRNWSVLGTRLLKIKTYYARPPRLANSRAYREEDRAAEDPEALLQKAEDERLYYTEWAPKDYAIPVQVFAEVTLGPEPLTREELRRICDRYGTKEEIIEALSVSSLSSNRLPLFLLLAAAGILLAVLLVKAIKRAAADAK